MDGLECSAEIRTGSIEKAQGVGILADHDGDGVVIEHLQGVGGGFGRRSEAWGEERITYGGDIFTGELVRRVRDEKTRLRAGGTQASRYGELACGGGREGETHLADRTVSYNNTLDRLHGSPGGLVGSSGGSWVRG